MHLLKPSNGTPVENPPKHLQSTPSNQTAQNLSTQPYPKTTKSVAHTKISLSTNTTPLQTTLKTPTLFKGSAEPMVNLLKKRGGKSTSSQPMFKIPFKSQTAKTSPVKEIKGLQVVKDVKDVKDVKEIKMVPSIPLQQASPPKKVASLIARNGGSSSALSLRSASKSPGGTGSRKTIKQLLGGKDHSKTRFVKKMSMGLTQKGSLIANPELVSNCDSNRNLLTRKRNVIQ